MSIQSFTDKDTKSAFYEGRVGKRCGWRGIMTVACRKLDLLDAAHCVGDLRAPPSNRLEALRGDLRGHYSIRINKRWRIMFRWPEGAANPEEVQIIDYH